MPLFKFACAACDAETELLVRGGESPACPSCGSADLQKLMSHFAPMGSVAPEPMGCGAPSCCQMQGGGCMN